MELVSTEKVCDPVTRGKRMRTETANTAKDSTTTPTQCTTEPATLRAVLLLRADEPVVVFSAGFAVRGR
jgi:hypothetical protein